jgi:ribosomal protein S18 acetylase RimI-like enzyme
MEVRPFADEHLETAAELLAERHRRHRAAEPLLPARYEAPAAALEELETLRRGEGSAGVVALGDGRLVGYLVGGPLNDEIWGANEWVEHAGHAVEAAELVRDLYAALAARWVEEGRTRHYVLVPASDVALVDTWFRLGFGQQQALGIRDVSAEPWPERVRAALPRDVDALVELAPRLREHQGSAPVFSAGHDWDLVDLRTEIETEIEDDATGSLVVEVDGRIVGNLVVTPVEKSGMHADLARPERGCYLAFAVTDPEVRGLGVGLALTQASFAWAHEQGYKTMVTDWRVTNLLASRFWPRRGFRLSFLRLYRSIP